MRRVFLSFDSDDLLLVNGFRGQAKAAKNDLEFRDWSVREPFASSNAEYVRAQIRQLIKQVSVTICLIGYATARSSWVNWEIQESIRQGKGVMGVRLHSNLSDMPPAAIPSGAPIIDWRIPEILAAIERTALRAGY